MILISFNVVPFPSTPGQFTDSEVSTNAKILYADFSYTRNNEIYENTNNRAILVNKSFTANDANTVGKYLTPLIASSSSIPREQMRSNVDKAINFLQSRDQSVRGVFEAVILRMKEFRKRL